MSFNPKETIDLSGHTGPFIQYTFVRIKRLLNKYEDLNNEFSIENLKLNPKELEVLKWISNFSDVLAQSAKELSPYLLANYLYSLVKSYNSFYQDHPIITEKEDFYKIKTELEKKIQTFNYSSVEWRPLNYVDLSNDQSEQINQIISALEELDDVQNIFTNANLKNLK